MKKNAVVQNVLVTTEHRGVFYGTLKDDKSPAEVTLAEARNVIYWASSVGGFLGLACRGPDAQCRVGPAVPVCRLFDITSVTPVTAAATEAFAAQPEYVG